MRGATAAPRMHGLWPGTGFKAGYHCAPLLPHPQYGDVAQAGMVHNVETGFHTEDPGVRCAEVVVDQPDRAEVMLAVWVDVL